MINSVYDPSIAPRKHIPLAPRPIDLRGKVVGLYDNTKEQADIILAAIGDQLSSRYGVKQLVHGRGVHYSKPAPTPLIDEMARKCDVIICALGG